MDSFQGQNFLDSFFLYLNYERNLSISFNQSFLQLDHHLSKLYQQMAGVMLEYDKYFLLSVMHWIQSIINGVVLNFNKTPPFVSAFHYQFCQHYNCIFLVSVVTHHLDLSQALLIVVVLVVDLIVAGIDSSLSQARLLIGHITIISNHLLLFSSDYYSEKHYSFKYYLENSSQLLLLSTHLLLQLKKIDYLLPPPPIPLAPPLIPLILLNNLNFQIPLACYQRHSMINSRVVATISAFIYFTF